MKNLVRFFIILSVLFISGCKSAMIEQYDVDIDPLSVLDNDSSIYISVPASKNQELVSKILCSRISDISEKNAAYISSKSEVLYAGLGTVEDRSRIQAAVKISIPKTILGAAFSKKNGWEKTSFSYENISFEKFVHSSDDFQVSFPVTGFMCAAQDVDPLLINYASLSDNSDYPWKEWIGQTSDDILFYITRPGQYLRGFIGQSVNIGTDYIYGEISYSPDNKNPDVYSGKYMLSFYIHLLNKRSVVLLKSLLNLSFAMSGGVVEQTDDFTLRLYGMEISDKQIEALFSRDPVTGKHYRVENDVVIEESVKR